MSTRDYNLSEQGLFLEWDIECASRVPVASLCKVASILCKPNGTNGTFHYGKSCTIAVVQAYVQREFFVCFTKI